MVIVHSYVSLPEGIQKSLEGPFDGQKKSENNHQSGVLNINQQHLSSHKPLLTTITVYLT
jgi:hypothetical protein